jgi:hypothetical protein
MNVFWGTIKEAKLFIEAKELFKILGSIGLAQARSIGSQQDAQIVVHVVVTAVVYIVRMGLAKRHIPGAFPRSRFCFPCFAGGDLLALVREPYGFSTHGAIESHAFTGSPPGAPGG